MKTIHLFFLATVLLASVSRSIATVHVRGSATADAGLITVEILADITYTPVISYSAKVFYDPSLLAVVSAAKNDALWHLSDGAGNAPYMDPDLSHPGEVLLIGAHWNATDPTAGVTGPGVLLGTIVFQRLSEKTPAFELSIGRGGDYASFVTATGTVLESLQGEVAFDGVAPPRDDRDLDGLGDRWEVEHFEDISLAYYSDDPDGDGINNDGEEDLGSDPTDSRSNLQLSIGRKKESIILEWTSFEERTYAVQFGENLSKFETIERGIRATPPVNSLELRATDVPGPGFYRVMLDLAGDK